MSDARRKIDFGELRRIEPVTRDFGFSRGQPVDRRYIESFLQRHAADIRGRVLEVGDDTYSTRFGGERITRLDIVDSRPNPRATLSADLSHAPHLPDGAFDCIVCTQTLLFIYDVHAAVRTLHRILAPRGVALVTVPGISQIVREDMNREGDFWRFTSRSGRQLFEECFAAAGVAVQTYGNVLAAVAFLHGLAVEDLSPTELDEHDPDYEVSIGIRAQK